MGKEREFFPLSSCLGPQTATGSDSTTTALGRVSTFRTGSHSAFRKREKKVQLPVSTNSWATSASLVSSPQSTYTSVNNSLNALQNYI